MIQLDRFLSELPTLYWWLSTFVVGIVINIASAYLKPPIDNWFDQRSAIRRDARRKTEEVFDQETSRIASDPTALILAGQAARHAEVRYLLECIATGINFILLYIISNDDEKVMGLTKFVVVSLVALLLFQFSSMFGAMRQKRAEQDKFQVALKKSLTLRST